MMLRTYLTYVSYLSILLILLTCITCLSYLRISLNPPLTESRSNIELRTDKNHPKPPPIQPKNFQNLLQGHPCYGSKDGVCSSSGELKRGTCSNLLSLRGGVLILLTCVSLVFAYLT